MDTEKEIFQGKKISDLVKEIYEKHKDQDVAISREVERLTELITSPGDAILIVPLLKGFFDSSLKNDETLLKILQIFQKAEDKSKSSGNDDINSLISESELQQLLSEIPKTEQKQLPQ